MDDQTRERQWRQLLEQRGTRTVREALSGGASIPGVDRAFAMQWLLERDLRLLRHAVFWARFRTFLLLLAALASIIMIMPIDAIWSWLQ